jgi:hypothetical protein
LGTGGAKPNGFAGCGHFKGFQLHRGRHRSSTAEMPSRRKAGLPPKPKGGARPGAGRKSKRNAAIERVLCEAVQLGMSTTRACALAKIDPGSFRFWCEKDPKLLERIEAARSRGILKALGQLEELKREGEVKAICWFLEKMDRSAYGNQTSVVGAQQNNFYELGNGKYSPPEEIAEFISRQRERMAFARSLRDSDPERARAIEAETLDIDSGMPAEDQDLTGEIEMPKEIATCEWGEVYQKVQTQTNDPL